MDDINTLYSELVNKLIERRLSITCMESMTGGFIASCITDISGASAVFKGSYVCYSNEEKIRLGVSADIIREYSVYSQETAMAMAEASERAFNSDIAIGITGNAGNVDPANLMGIPGTVFIALIVGGKRKTVIMNLNPTLTRGQMKKIIATRVAEELLALV